VRTTPIDLVNNFYTNYFFCPATYLVEMVPRCEPPHFDTEAAKRMCCNFQGGWLVT